MASRADAELIRRVAAGDVEAMGELYDRHSPMLLPIALRIVRDRTEAEDILHDAFIAVSERASQYVEARGSVVAWLVTLMRNLSIDRTRRSGRRQAIARDFLSNEPPPSERSPEGLMYDAVERAKIRRAIASLPEAQRETLELAFFEGLSYPEIAERKNVPLGTVKSRAARALSTLHAVLASEG
jgi:RNA polymerase sigma-70 factor (ECF subfamily)